MKFARHEWSKMSTAVRIERAKAYWICGLCATTDIEGLDAVNEQWTKYYHKLDELNHKIANINAALEIELDEDEVALINKLLAKLEEYLKEVE